MHTYIQLDVNRTDVILKGMLLAVAHSPTAIGIFGGLLEGISIVATK